MVLNTRSIPIFIHHEGNSQYLKEVINQAEEYNECVILFGDKSNAYMTEKWVDVTNFHSNLWDEFMSVYENMSFYSYDYAVQIFKRFFVFYDYIEESNLDGFICLDSDVLVFVNFSTLELIKKYKTALCVPYDQSNMRIAAGAGCSYWTKESLKSFIDFCIYTYKHDRGWLLEKYQYHIDNNMPGGVCEMNLLYKWYIQHEDETWNWIKYNASGVVDQNFGLSENYLQNEYEMDKYNVGKVIKYVSNQPYFIHQDGHLVPVWAIHFGGGSKMYIRSFRRFKKIIYIIPYILEIKKIMNRLLGESK